MLKRILLYALFFTLLAVPAALAQDAAQLPDTPVGKQFEQLLASLVNGDYGDYIKNNFSEEFLKEYSMEDHLGFLRQLSIMHGGFTVHSIEAATEHEMTVLAISNKRENNYRRLSLKTDPEPPHKVSSFDGEMAPPPADAPEPEKMETEAEILAFVESELKRLAEVDEFSGAVLIAKNGKPLFKQAYGLASKRFNVPNNVETKFNLGSINKSFTGMAMAQLLEQGKVALDDPLSTYLPDFPKDVADKVTVEHLLTMTSGMSDYWNEQYEAAFTKIRTVDALIDIIKEIPLDFEPGTQQQYSNSGYAVLGAIIESVTGQSYYDYVREHIFEVAGMKNTDSYEMDQIVPNLAIGYTVNLSPHPYQDNKFQNNLFVHSVKGAPAGGGYSTVDDLMKYVEAMKANKLAGARYTNMAMGFFRNLDNLDERPPAIGIAGGAPVGINAIVGAVFESGYTIVVLSNYDPPTAMEFGGKVLRMLRDLPPS